MLASREARSTDGGESDEAVETESFVLTAGTATSIMKDDVLVERRVALGVGAEIDAAAVSSVSGARVADAPRASLVELRLVGIVTIGECL
jgi:hypothetical protein